MKPAIVGISATALTAAEIACLESHVPLGLILFARNIEDPDQLAALTGAIRQVLPDALLMLDQEGGRVARLRPPHWRPHPAARLLRQPRAAWLTGALIGLDCRQAGIDVVTAPVLDVTEPGSHAVIGDRAFSDDAEEVAVLGAAFAAGLLAAGVQPVGKHAPGHGRARADSHLAMPELASLLETDILPFARNRGLPWLMTAHIRYADRDMDNPATLSRAIIEGVIRAPEAIGFTGVLVTDDLAMHALSGTPGDRARQALAAGCDVALHCSGNLECTLDLLEAIPPAGEACLARVAAARRLAGRSCRQLDATSLVAERAALLA